MLRDPAATRAAAQAEGEEIVSAAFETARDAAEHGLRVLPAHSIGVDGRCTCGNDACSSAGKHPRTTSGLLDASSDEGQLLRWNDRWPDANWGLACGERTVIDVDPKHGADPRELIDEHDLSHHPVVLTGEWEGVRGAHVYCAGGSPTGSATLPGVHVRGLGSYVLLPGSRHWSGVSYEWANGTRPWRTKLEPLPPAFEPRRAGNGSQAPPPGRIPHGERHAFLTDRAVRLVRAGVTDPEEILAHLLIAFDQRCEPIPVPEPGSLERLAQWAADSEMSDRERAAGASRFSRYRNGGGPGGPPPVGDRPGGPRRLRVLDIEAMLSSPPPPVPWTVEPILALGCTTMIAGREGRGKSLLALAIAATGGHGENVAGMAPSDSFRTLYVDAENGSQEAHRRVYGLSVSSGALVYVEADGFNLRADFDELVELVREHEPNLLILDSLRSLAPGLDENDSLKVEDALRPVVKLGQREGISNLSCTTPRGRAASTGGPRRSVPRSSSASP